MSSDIPPLDREKVLVVYEEGGALKYARTRYDAVRRGVAGARLAARKLYWIYDRSV